MSIKTSVHLPLCLGTPVLVCGDLSHGFSNDDRIPKISAPSTDLDFAKGISLNSSVRRSLIGIMIVSERCFWTQRSIRTILAVVAKVLLDCRDWRRATCDRPWNCRRLKLRRQLSERVGETASRAAAGELDLEAADAACEREAIDRTAARDDEADMVEEPAGVCCSQQASAIAGDLIPIPWGRQCHGHSFQKGEELQTEKTNGAGELATKTSPPDLPGVGYRGNQNDSTHAPEGLTKPVRYCNKMPQLPIPFAIYKNKNLYSFKKTMPALGAYGLMTVSLVRTRPKCQLDWLPYNRGLNYDRGFLSLLYLNIQSQKY